MAESFELQTEILTAALNSLEDGVAVLDAESRVLLWNHAARALAGYKAADLLSRKLPSSFYQMVAHQHGASDAEPKAGNPPRPISDDGGALAERPMQVLLHHAEGHTLPAMLRRIPLRDALGKRFGTLLRFHSIEEMDTLTVGVNDEEGLLGKQVEHSQADMEDRLEEAAREWNTSGVPFGLLWITIDQAANLRKTHGRDAAEAMLAIVERTLLHALRPTEILGRWGSNEYLVLCHERSAAMLEAHARRVCDLARTSDFRWWGDRADLSVSIGAAQVEDAEKLSMVLKRAQRAMRQSEMAGGNRVTLSDRQASTDISGTRGQECSQS